jgi:histidinol-phosphate/aromatic aminotransferase/cobyric acid decarboxylase-like protein
MKAYCAQCFLRRFGLATRRIKQITCDSSAVRLSLGTREKIDNLMKPLRNAQQERIIPKLFFFLNHFIGLK